MSANVLVVTDAAPRTRTASSLLQLLTRLSFAMHRLSAIKNEGLEQTDHGGGKPPSDLIRRRRARAAQNSSIAAFSADVSSGASMIPTNAPGDSLDGAVNFPLDRVLRPAKGHSVMPSFRLGIRTRIGSILKSRLCWVDLLKASEGKRC